MLKYAFVCIQAIQATACADPQSTGTVFEQRKNIVAEQSLWIIAMARDMLEAARVRVKPVQTVAACAKPKHAVMILQNSEYIITAQAVGIALLML